MPDELIWSGETSIIIQDLSNDFGTPGTYGWALIYPAISNLSGDIFVFVGQGENWEGEAFLYDWDSDFNGGVADNPDNIYVVENAELWQ